MNKTYRQVERILMVAYGRGHPTPMGGRIWYKTAGGYVEILPWGIGNDKVAIITSNDGQHQRVRILS
jgi:hypothetical protein